ncbi:MAG: LCP family protein [Acidimicrobiia bacterium]
MAVFEYVVFHPWRVLVTVVAGVLLGVAAFYVFQVQAALNSVAVEDFDPEGARRSIEVSTTEVTDWVFVEPSDYTGDEDTFDLQSQLAESFDLTQSYDPSDFSPSSFGEPIDDSLFTAYLLVGTDASKYLADVIILALEPADGSAPIMVSIPRDLYVWNVCKGTFTRINAGLGGCPRVASGTEMLAILVEDYTGIPIDHSARVDFNGFARIVDAMGGTTICVDFPTRDQKSHLDIPEAGCRKANGALTLAWVRSRHTEQLKGGEWVQVVGSDYARQTRQQDVLFQLAAKAAGFSSPASLTSRLSAAVSSLRLDSSWSFGQAIGSAWKYRGISKTSVKRFSISATNYRTPAGAAVLLPKVPFAQALGEVYPLP